jgi:hypothetical protein
MAHMLQQQQVVAAEHAVLLTQMLNTAGVKERLAAAQWLHAQGAQWPVVLHFAVNEQQQWRGTVLAWAVAMLAYCSINKQGNHAHTTAALHDTILYHITIRLC